MRFVHWHRALPVDVPERMTVSRITIARAERTPPPRPRARLPAPARTQRHRPIAVPHVAARAGAQSASVAVQSAPTPVVPPPARKLATPTVVKNAGCSVANAVPAVRATPEVPDIPSAVRASAKVGLTQVRVSLNPDGSVAGALVDRSSGSDELDRIALTVAKGSTYSAALVACKPVAATYDFRVRFVTPLQE